MSASAIDKGHPASDLRLVWKPLEIGATRVKNRIMMTAQTTLYGALRQGQHSRRSAHRLLP